MSFKEKIISMEVEKEIKVIQVDESTLQPKTTSINVKERNRTVFEDSNNENTENVNLIYGLHILSVVGVCILFSSPVILIPQHDAIQLPEYWYELLMTFSLTYPMQWTTLVLLDNHFLLHIKHLRSPKSWFVLAFTPALVFILIYCSLYLFWTYKLGYNFPMPLANFISQLTCFPFLLTLWHVFPKEMRINLDSRK